MPWVTLLLILIVYMIPVKGVDTRCTKYTRELPESYKIRLAQRKRKKLKMLLKNIYNWFFYNREYKL